MEAFQLYLEEQLPQGDCLKLVKQEAARFQQTNTPEACCRMALTLYESNRFQVQEVGVLLLGYAAPHRPEALSFLRDTVSRHESWKVQEVLAMAFDHFCRITGYEAALPIIRAWLADGCANVRRAASEGLRIWTKRPYFREHPQAAVALLAARKGDPSEFVRKSIGNALRDISKQYPELVAEELRTWDLSVREIRQTARLAGRLLNLK